MLDLVGQIVFELRIYVAGLIYETVAFTFMSYIYLVAVEYVGSDWLLYIGNA